MAIDHRVEAVLLKALNVNLGYRPGEKVVIVAQEWDPSLGESAKPTLKDL